jgi:hypothetical protein
MVLSHDVQFRGRMFLMGQLSAANSSPVPLGFINWDWTARAHQQAGAWTLNPDEQYVIPAAFQQQAVYPEWKTLALNISEDLCQPKLP